MAGEPGWVNAYPNFLAMQAQQQDKQVQAWQFQQAQRQAAQQQAAQQAAGNALPGLLQPPPQVTPSGQAFAQPQGQPAPQPPQPGQASQNGGPPPQVNRPPIPPGGVQGSMPPSGTPPLPPFKGMPTSPPPQQQAAPSAISPPPAQAPQQPQAQQGGPLTLDGAVKALQAQGLSGADLLAGLQQLTPLLDSQSKQQAAQLQQQFQHELQIANLQERYDALHEHSQNEAASLQERAQAHQDSLGVQQQLLGMRAQAAKSKLQDDQDALLSPEDAKLLAQQSLAGDNSALTGLGRGTQGAKNLVAIAKQKLALAKEQNLSGADLAANTAAFQGEKAAARTSAVTGAKMSQAADEASQLGDQALAVSSRIARTNAPTINAGLNTLREQSGDPAVSQFKVAVQGFRNTYSRAITPSGTPSVHDKQHADELFSLDQSPAQFAASIAQAKKEMAVAIKAPGDVQAQQRARISGKPAATPAPSGGIPAGWTVTEH
jgi:hypothetical protein